MQNDHVICNNCGTEQIVSLGSDECLQCGSIGTLRWVDEDRPEVDA